MRRPARDDDWNAQYEKSVARAQHQSTRVRERRLSSDSKHRDNTKANIDKKGNRVTSVNGYNVTSKLGQGAYGEVFLAANGGEKYALKVLKKSALKRQQRGKMGSALDTVKTEIATMKKIVHPNCVLFHDVILDAAQDEIFLILEFVEGGTSQPEGADGKPIPLAERTIWSHMRHLVLGLEYLHMHNIVHRDIKPENLLLSSHGMLKIADFGTSCFCEGDANAQKTAGTPPFFSPELCSKESSGTYDSRVVDLWAVGVTIYLWCSGRTPFVAPTVMLLMEAIKQAPAQVPAPKEAVVANFRAVIEGLMTRDPQHRLTLNQLRMHPWLTNDDKVTLPQQPVMKVNVTQEEIEQAVSNRAAIAYQSSAGPSSLARATGYIADWKREGQATIRKKATEAEANFYRAISASGHLSPHIPVIYSIDRPSEHPTASFRTTSKTEEQVYEVRMQDLAGGMTWPCAMAFVMGCRTATPGDFLPENARPPAEMLASMAEIDPQAPTQADADAGTITQLSCLRFLDERSSTATLGFRIDAAKTVVGGAGDAREIQTLPLPAGQSLGTLREESQVMAAMSTFMQADLAVAKAVVVKLEALDAALVRSDFIGNHALLRTTLLLVYDDDARDERLELKMMNFGFSYALSPGEEAITHQSAWDGTASCHEDGYLTGLRSLTRLMRQICNQLEGKPADPPSSATGPAATTGADSKPGAPSTSGEVIYA